MDLGIDYALTQAYNMNHYFLVDTEGEIRVINKLSGTDINYSRPVVINSIDYETGEVSVMILDTITEHTANWSNTSKMPTLCTWI